MSLSQETPPLAALTENLCISIPTGESKQFFAFLSSGWLGVQRFSGSLG